MKTWWARVRTASQEYGHWIPTPETDLAAAIFYLTRIRRIDGTVVEFLLQ